MGNCLFLRARGWGIDRQVRKKWQIPGGVSGGGMVTGRIEPCITLDSLINLVPRVIWLLGQRAVASREVSTGDRPLTKKPDDSGYEIVY